MHMVLKFYRLIYFLHQKKFNRLAKIVWLIKRIIFACDIGIGAKIEKGVKFYHNGLGCVIHPRSIIGENTSVYQNVTLGGNGKSKELNGAPRIGKSCFIGAGSVLVGPIVIGNNVTIGANSVVLEDVPENVVVAGNPATIIKMKECEYES